MALGDAAANPVLTEEPMDLGCRRQLPTRKTPTMDDVLASVRARGGRVTPSRYKIKSSAGHFLHDQ
jgi:hypothetical protein